VTTRLTRGGVAGLGLAAFGVAASLVLCADGAPNPASGDAWPMFRGASSLDGVAQSGLPQALKLRWRYQAKDAIESSAAVADGVVYVGSMDGLLAAVDLASGQARWHYQTGGAIEESSPNVARGLVVVGDMNGVVHGVDAATGKPRWTFKTDGEIRSSPNRVGDRIYIGSYDQHLYCLSAETGALLWKYQTEGPVHGTPAVADGAVYISGCDETFRAIDALTGKQRFAVPMGAYSGASAAVRGDRAYVGTFGNDVLGIDLATHVVRWTYQHPTRRFPFYSSAAVTPERVILGGRDKLVHCLDAATGKAIWTFLTKARVESSPVVVGSRVFVGSNDGVLYELALATGRKVWEYTAGAPLSASPAVAEGVLVIGSQDGVLYAFGS